MFDPAKNLPVATPDSPAGEPEPVPARFGWLRPSHKHTALSATLLISGFALISRVIGLVRDKYIAYTFGAGPGTDAYNIAFQLPDLINYLLIGGAASISFVTILSRYREAGEHEEGDKALSVILNTMLLALGSAILLAEVAAPLYSRIFFSNKPAEAALATYMTRILLPGQIFFFAGGVLASVALVRKQFAYQAISPLVYTVFIILGGVLLSHSIGIPSLAYGALAGSFAGPFLVNAFAAHRAGVRYQPVLDFRNPGLRAWVRMSIPLMLGVTVVFMDNIILTYFAKHATGDISRLMYAKRLFTAPMAIIGQAAGAASLPFFASLYSRSLFTEYASAVNRAVTRILSASVMFSAVMFALAGPTVDLIFRGGSFNRADSGITAVYFEIFTLSLALWSAQALYSRAFFAAGETLAPMRAGTVITALSILIYWQLHRSFGVVGLAWASNLAILVHTMTLAVLAHRRRLVSLRGLDLPEIARSLFAALVSFSGVLLLLHVLPHGTRSYLADLLALAAGGLLWIAICLVTLRLTGSKLVNQLRSRTN
ncbi:MAG: polysaccharide biosynthesis C-terminal domain-containing protein [Acidobacteriota bacterium]|nr:polysaccharide biosynthesis C-terminal domain-containing protein [Acidobacteriota bacterium]